MIQIREFESKDDYARMVDYFLQSTPAFLNGMGIEPSKLPKRDEWLEAVWADHHRPYGQRDRIYLAWIYRGDPVGHSSINKMVWEKEASIHLHLWRPELRRQGVGAEFFAQSTNYFMRHFGFPLIYCEPYAENPAPNRVLSKLGFKFVRRYRTIPSTGCFEQDVNRYETDHEIELNREEWIIKSAGSNEEWDQALELLASVYVGENFTSPDIANELFKRGRLEGKGDLLVAATRDGNVIGAAILVGELSELRQVSQTGEAEFRLLAVRHDARGKGVGRRLVQECLRRALNAGAREMVLSTQPSMQAAHRLYEDLQFKRRPDRDWQTSNGGIRWVYSLELKPDSQ